MGVSHVIMLYVDTESDCPTALGAYCTGCVHPNQGGSLKSIAKIARSEMVFGAWWEKHIQEHQGLDEEYPKMYFNVAETPGWVMDGYGVDYRVGSAKAKKIKHPHPSQMSLSIAVDELPPQEVWDEFVQRAKDFCAQKYCDAVKAELFAPENIVLSGVRQEDVTIDTQIKTTRKQIM